MKKIFKYLLLCLVGLIPFGVNAIKTENIKMGETRDGYYCYLLKSDDSASSYDVVYSYRLFGGMTYKEGTEASQRPSIRCLDSTYNEKKDFLVGSNCFFDLYGTKTMIDGHKLAKYSYSGWDSKITDSNRYISNPKDCIAASIVTDGICSASNCKGSSSSLFIEAKTNSEFYTDTEMSQLKVIDPYFGDNTEFCYASTIQSYEGAVEKIYFGHPMFYIDYTGVKDDMSNYDDPAMALVKEEKDGKHVVNFSGIETTTSTKHCADFPEGKICLDGFPYVNDEIVTFETLKSLGNEQKTWKSFILTDGKGLITNSEDCNGLAKQNGYDEIVDNTVEDEDRPITTEDFADKLISGQSKKKAIQSCYVGDSKDGNYHCYRYTFLPVSHPMYNTTVWTKKQLSCGFELTEWDWTQCKKSALDVTYKQCKTIETLNKDGSKTTSEYCKNITHSGYNGVPDFYDERDNKDAQIECDNLNAFHIIYRAITITAPILTLLFVTFDLISSVVSGDPKKVAKFRSKLIRRLIALILLIVAPILIHLIVNTLSKNSSLKNMKYLQCVVVGNGTDIHKKVDKSIKTKGNTTTTDSDSKNTGNSNSSGTSTLVKTVETDTSKQSPKLIKEVTINGKDLNYDTDTNVYDIEVPAGTQTVQIDAEPITNNVKIISGEGTNSIGEGVSTINIVATNDDDTYDVVTINVSTDDDTNVEAIDNDVDIENANDLDDDELEDEDEEDDEPYEIIQEVQTTKLTESEIKTKRNAFVSSAKKLKKLTSKSGSKTFWCAKRTKCIQKNKKGKCTKKKVVNPACTTKTVEKIYGNKQKYGKYVGGYSCASLVSFALYDSGLYTADEVNHVSGSNTVRNINSANSVAKFLVAKGWTVITKTKDLQPGDVIFENRSSKPAVKAGGKTYHPGHVEIYAGNGKTYNTGGTSIQHTLTQKLNTKGFAFALRYNGK